MSQLHDLITDAQGEGLSQTSVGVLVENLNALTEVGAQGTDVNDLAGDHVNLVCIVLDHTGSMEKYRSDVIAAYNLLLQAVTDSKAADEILLSTWKFDTRPDLFHGYLLLDQVPRLDHGSYEPGGMTALYDAVLHAFTATVAYGQTLRNSGISTKVIIVVVSDGEDNSSRSRPGEVKVVAEDLLRQEYYTLALVGFGTGFAQTAAREMGFPDENVLEAAADAHSIRKAMDTVSKSVIRASQAKVGSSGFFS